MSHWLFLVLALLIPSCYGMTCSATVNGQMYDLSSLSGVDVFVSPPSGAYNYYINVCGAVQASTCGSRGSAFTCQVRKSPVDQFESVIAYSDDNHPPPPVWAPSLVNATAGVRLTFTNGDTCNLKQRVMIIDFHCDKSGAAPTVVESPQCTFNVDYPTPVVCPGYVPTRTPTPTPDPTPTPTPTPFPPPIMPCSQTINGVLYDLTPLTGVDMSVVPFSGAYNYYINVCGAVQASTCSNRGSAFACQVRKSPPDQFESVTAYSDVVGHPPAPTWGPSSVYAAAGVKLTFVNGDSCNLKQRVMIIDFHCDKSGTAPTVMENPQCTFNIDYPTPVVCPGYKPTPSPVPTPTPAPIPTIMPCSNTINGKLYDLSPLTGTDVGVIPASGAYNYYINVCGAVQSSSCAQRGSVFACQTRKSPLDQFESVVAFSDLVAHPPAPTWGPSSVNAAAGVKLTFVNGDSCNLKQRVMIIDFHCDKSGTAPTVMENPQCTFNVDYPTPVVCPGYVPPTSAPTPTPTPPLMMSCKQTVAGITYDLTPLQGTDLSIIPSAGSYNYYMSVCGAVQASTCGSHPSAFLCQVRKSPLNQFEAVNAYSDGKHTPEPIWSPSPYGIDGVTVTFTNGDLCNLQRRTTIINFFCDPTGTQPITILETPQCTFTVQFPTGIMCNATSNPFSFFARTVFGSSTYNAHPHSMTILLMIIGIVVCVLSIMVVISMYRRMKRSCEPSSPVVNDDAAGAAVGGNGYTMMSDREHA